MFLGKPWVTQQNMSKIRRSRNTLSCTRGKLVSSYTNSFLLSVQIQRECPPSLSYWSSCTQILVSSWWSWKSKFKTSDKSTKMKIWDIMLPALEQQHVCREYVPTMFALVRSMALSHSDEFIHSGDWSVFGDVSRLRIIVGERNWHFDAYYDCHKFLLQLSGRPITVAVCMFVWVWKR